MGHPTEVVARIMRGEIECLDCNDDEGDPVFHGFEVDTPSHCSKCGECIDGQRLTDDGREYVADALLDATEPKPCLDAWADLLDDRGTSSHHDAACRVYRWTRAKSVLLDGQPQAAIPEPLRGLLDAGDELAGKVDGR